jgi:DNA-directed RNA polymerase specialized sigma24 family protein
MVARRAAVAGSESDLLSEAIEGDSIALGTLLKHHADELARCIRLDDRWNAQFDINDVLQVTFLEAFLRIRRFKPDGPGNFIGWLLTIAKNN